MEDQAYEAVTAKIASGDVVVLYTDGLTDRLNEAGEFYSIDRIAALLERSCDADLASLYDSIYEDVRTFAATDDFKDDIAFVVTRFQ